MSDRSPHTGLHEDIATIHRSLQYGLKPLNDESRAALVRIEEQLQSAERERDEARSTADGMARAPYGEFEKMREERDGLREQLRIVQANFHDAEKARIGLLEQIQTIERDRDEWKERAILTHAEGARMREQLEATREAFRLIAQVCGEDGTEPGDWRAMTFPPPAALALGAARRLRADYDEALDSIPAISPKEGA